MKKSKTHFFQNRFNQLFEQFSRQESRAKRRVLVKKGVDCVSVSADLIAYFFTEYKLVFLVDREGKKYVVDKTLTDLENELDPTTFYHANHKLIVNIKAIEKFESDNGKIQLHIAPLLDEPIAVSKETRLISGNGSMDRWMRMEYWNHPTLQSSSNPIKCLQVSTSLVETPQYTPPPAD